MPESASRGDGSPYQKAITEDHTRRPYQKAILVWPSVMAFWLKGLLGETQYRKAITEITPEGHNRRPPSTRKPPSIRRPPNQKVTKPEGTKPAGHHQSEEPNQKATFNQKATKPEGHTRRPHPSGGWFRGCLLQGECLLLGEFLVPGEVSALGGLVLGGVCSQGVGVCSRGVSAPGGWYPSMHWGRHPPVNRMTNRCKNITLATTSLRPVKMTLRCYKFPTVLVVVFLLHQAEGAGGDAIYKTRNLAVEIS